MLFVILELSSEDEENVDNDRSDSLPQSHEVSLTWLYKKYSILYALHNKSCDSAAIFIQSGDDRSK